MSNENSKPTHRLMCARIGQDADGKTKLGNMREIGAVWPAKEGKKWAQVSFDLMPTELAQGNAMLFLAPIEG